MQCPKCQFENPADSNFCLECGQKLERNCPQCEKVLPLAAKFCNGCGRDLTANPVRLPGELSFDEKLDKIQRYLPKGLTEKILAQRGRIEGERKQVTVMFCDMEGFTRLSEKIGSENVYTIMDELYEILIHKVHDYGGTVNEMTGDGIMALFGAPVALEDAPQRAIRSSLSIHREMVKFNEWMKTGKEKFLPVRMRIGIHSGPVVVGTMGNDLRVEFKVVGDTVNLASRTEGLAEPGTTYITEDTFKLTEGLFRVEALGERKIKGKQEPVRIFRVIAASTSRTRFDISAERGLTPFVGRERELELLLDGFERAKDGHGQAFSVISEAGVGKSRLLYEFRKAVSNENVTFLEGKCLSYSNHVAYHPIFDTLKSNFDIQEGATDIEINEKVSRGLKILNVDEASILPYILELFSVKNSGIDEAPSNPAVKKERILNAVKMITIKGSEIRPLILAIEDLHWIDKSSEEYLKHLMDSISGARVFLVFTYRPDFVHTWGAKSYHSQVNLNRLANRECLTMLSYLLDSEAFDKELEELILQKTEGVPFFIEEFIKSLEDLQLLEKKNSILRLVKEVRAVAIPAGIQDVIMARVDSLPEGARELVQTGSVVGREFSHELFEQLINLPEKQLLSELSVLKNAELIYERGIYPQSTYIFKHALTQDVVYNSLLNKKKKEIHRTIGNAIEALYPERLGEFCEILANHFSKADESEKAYHYLKLAGNKAMGNHSNWEAFHYYKEANLVLKKEYETEENLKRRLEILQLMIGPMRILGYPEDSAQILYEGENLLNKVGGEKSLTHIYSTIGHYNITKGDSSQGLEYSEKSYQEAVKTQDIDLIVKTGWYYCSAIYVTGRFVKLVELAQEVLVLLKNSKNEQSSFGLGVNVYSGLLGFKGCALGWLGDFREGELFLEQGLDFAYGIDDKTCLGLVEWFYGMFLMVKGDWKRVIEHLEQSIQHLEDKKFFMILGAAWMKLGIAYYFVAELAKAKRCTAKGLDIHKNTGLNYWLSLGSLALGMIDFDLGDLRGAQIHLKEAVKLAQNSNEKHVEGISQLWLGKILGRTKPPQIDRALKHILQGVQLNQKYNIKPEYARGHLFLGELYLDMAEKEMAIKCLKISEAMFQEMGMDYWLKKTRAVLGNF